MGQATDLVEVTDQQAEAVDKVVDWYHDGDQVFRLFGYAGTGKTTLAQILVDELDLRGKALYAAYTGKAAYVLRSKGANGASTVHSLIYTPVDKEEVREELSQLRQELREEGDETRRDDILRRIAAAERKLASPEFVLKEDSDLEYAALLVLDEVSMVGYRMAQDLLSFGTKLLVLGDPAQLPPVDGGGYFINAEPNHLLTEIHRSALDSPVTRLATTVRHARIGDRDYGVTGPDGHSGRTIRLTRDQLLEADQVLVGTNRTRWRLIDQIRSMYGWNTPEPQAGDRIVVLVNNYEAAVFNGQTFTVAMSNPDPKQPDILHMLVYDDEGDYRVLQVWADGFTGIEGEVRAKRNGRSRIVAATFGQVLTVHKSQGSQWESVLVVDESDVFAGMAFREAQKVGNPDAHVERHLAGQRWLYTGITRAAERVVIAPGRR